MNARKFVGIRKIHSKKTDKDYFLCFFVKEIEIEYGLGVEPVTFRDGRGNDSPALIVGESDPIYPIVGGLKPGDSVVLYFDENRRCCHIEKTNG